MAAKTKEVWAENPVEGYARIFPRRISSPLKDFNVEIGVSKPLAPGKSMVKSASWSDFAGPSAASKVAAPEAGASAASKVAAPESGASAASKKVAAPEVVAVAEAGAARSKKKSAAAEAKANKKAIRKANKAAAAAQAAAKKPYPFSVPSEDYFNLWKDPKDREEVRAILTRIAELFAQ